MKNIGLYWVSFCVLAAILLAVVAWYQHNIGYVFAGIVVLLCALYWIFRDKKKWRRGSYICQMDLFYCIQCFL